MKDSVLVVEPSKDLADILKQALKISGIKSSVAHSAQSGITTADKVKPKLVLLELLMNDHNGLEFIHEFKSYQDWFDIPIIIYSEIALEQLAIEPGMMNDMNIIKYFYKPKTSLSELTDFVSETLK